MKHLGLVLMVILFTTIFESCSERIIFSEGEWIDLTHENKGGGSGSPLRIVAFVQD